MITWVTVWVLTVQYSIGSPSNTVFQLTYATQKACEGQLIKHEEKRYTKVRCDFQQIPVVTK